MNEKAIHSLAYSLDTHWHSLTHLLAHSI